MSPASAMPAVSPASSAPCIERAGDDEADVGAGVGEGRQVARRRRAAGDHGQQDERQQKRRDQELRAAELDADGSTRQRGDDAPLRRGVVVERGGRHATASAGSASTSVAVCPVTARNTSSSVGVSTSTVSTSIPLSSSVRITGAIARAPADVRSTRPPPRRSLHAPCSGERRARGGGLRIHELDVQCRLADARLQVVGSALRDDLAAVDDADAICELLGLFEVLRGQEDRRALRLQMTDLAPQRRAARRVETGGRLVEEQHPRAMHERHREVEPATHPARVGAEPPVGRVHQFDALEQLVGADARLAPAQPVQRALEAQQLAPVMSGSSAASWSATPIARRTAPASATTS